MYKLTLPVLVVLLLAGLAAADSIYTDQINFEPNSSRTHSQVITADVASDLVVVLDGDFSLTGSNPAALAVGDNLTWSGVTSVFFNLTSPANCTEGDVYRMPVYIAGSFFNSFTFICMPDNKIVDYKAEYGHGDSNYLSDDYRYLPDSDISLFNLIRVWTYGSYLDPDEDGLNASITCYFPDYLVMTRQSNQGTDIEHGDSGTTATFHWTSLFGNWFRVAPLEQEITGLSVGDYYNVSCNEVTYQYTTGQIRAWFDNVSFEIRSETPLNVSATPVVGNGWKYNITNIEKYPIYELEFLWTTSIGDTWTEDLRELLPGESVQFDVPLGGNGSVTLDATFVPVWYKESLKQPHLYQQWTDNFTISAGSGVPRATLTHYPPINVDQEYEAKFVFEEDGIPFDLTFEPVIQLLYPNGSAYVTSTMTRTDTGVYEYSTYITDLTQTGTWLTRVNASYAGATITRFDYWEYDTAEAELDVSIASLCVTDPNADPVEREVCADISITNLGTITYEYIYKYWVSDNESHVYNDTNVTDRGTNSKAINPGDTYIVTRCLDSPPDDVTHYYQAEVSFGGTDTAITSYNNGVACVGSTQGGGGSGSGRTVEEGREEIIEAPPGFIDITPNMATFVVVLGLLMFLLWRRQKKHERETHYREPYYKDEERIKAKRTPNYNR